MSRNSTKPGKRERSQLKAKAEAGKARKRIWVKPERYIQADKYGNVYYASRRDSTIGCMFETQSNIRVENMPITKPVGLVDERLTPEARIEMVAAEYADMLQARRIRKMPDKLNGLNVNTAVAFGKMAAANPHGMFDENGSRVTGPHIMAKFLTKVTKAEPWDK